MSVVAVATLGGACRSSTEEPRSACASPLSTHPEGAPWTPAPDRTEAIAATFEISVDLRHPALSSTWREPQTAPVTVKTMNGTLRAVASVKRFAQRTSRLYVALYLVNDDAIGVRDAALSFDRGVLELSADPFSDATAVTKVRVGGIAPEGVGHVAFGFDLEEGATSLTFRAQLAGSATTRVAQSSTPIAVTPDGAEVWATMPDSDVLSVIDTKTDRRVATVPAAGRPSSVAVTPDGRLVLAACATCNQLAIVDRASRAVLQVLGEDEGIGREPRNIVLSPDGTHAYVSAYVGDSVTELERVGDAFAVRRTVSVGRRPTGLSITPDGSTVYVAHFLPRGPIDDNGAWVTVLDAATMTTSDAELRDDGNAKEAACLKLISTFADHEAKDLSFEASPTQLSGLFLEPGGSEGFAPGLRVAGFPIFEGDVTKLGFEFLALGANSPAMLFPFDTREPKKARPRRSPAMIDVTDRSEDFLRCTPFLEELEGVRNYPGADPETIANPGVTIPGIGTFLTETGVARFVGFSRGGRRALVLSYAADELIVLDTATHSPIARGHLLLSGSNPTGLVVTPDGSKAYVAYENSTFVSVLDLAAFADPKSLAPVMVPYRLGSGIAAGQGATIVTFQVQERNLAGVPALPPVKETGTVALVDGDPLDAALRRGRVLFTSSSPVKYPTLSGHKQASCSSCHPNGGNDGTVWSTMEGERRTIGLWGGTAGRGWLHASATHRDARDFADVIVRQRLGGTGLSADDLDALSRYVAFGIPTVQRPRVDATLSSSGEAIFAKRCAACHVENGAAKGSGNADPSSVYGGGKAEGPNLYDIGTATDWAYVTLGPAYTKLFPPAARKVLDALRGDRALGDGDAVQATLAFSPRPNRARGMFKTTPLVNVWENATFFHDGRFQSLPDAVADIARRTGTPLSNDELAAVVEYLKTL
jgi:YVTN family beta-propeller protein